MKVIPLSEAKANLRRYGHLCHDEPIVVTVNGVPSFQLVPIEDDENLVDRLRQSARKQSEPGQTFPHQHFSPSPLAAPFVLQHLQLGSDRRNFLRRIFARQADRLLQELDRLLSLSRPHQPEELHLPL